MINDVKNKIQGRAEYIIYFKMEIMKLKTLSKNRVLTEQEVLLYLSYEQNIEKLLKIIEVYRPWIN